MTTDFEGLLGSLIDGGVSFILVGGGAAVAHGSVRLTEDIDVVYERTPYNYKNLCTALSPLNPYLRGAPEGLPFSFDEETVASGLNFTLMTSLGALDLLGEITGGGSYQNLLAHTIVINVFGKKCRCLTLPKLIEVKRAAGRPKDLETIAELEQLMTLKN